MPSLTSVKVSEPEAQDWSLTASLFWKQAQDFRNTGTQIRRKMWLQNMKVKLIVLGILIALILIIVLSVCHGFNCGKWACFCVILHLVCESSLVYWHRCIWYKCFIEDIYYVCIRMEDSRYAYIGAIRMPFFLLLFLHGWRYYIIFLTIFLAVWISFGKWWCWA